MSEIKPTLAKNVLTLVTHGKPLVGKETGLTRVMELGLPMGTAQRVIDDEQDVRLTTIDKLAEGLRVQPWQLLVPDISRDSLPELISPEVRRQLNDIAGELAGALSLQAEEVARRLDALKSAEARQMAFAGMDHVLQLAERLQRASDAQPSTEGHAAADKQPPTPTRVR